MSEYQYYEFLAIDRPLSEREVEQVREYSTRAEITSARFVNEYHWGNFRGDPYKFLEKWFDVMVHYANWGTHRLMMRVPADALDVALVKRYCAGNCAQMKSAGNNLILDLQVNQEEHWEYEEAETYTSSLVPVRSALLNGDYRPLYLGWLACVQSHDLAERDAEPPVPPGLAKRSGSLKALADFLWIDQDLLAAAAQASGPAETAGDEGFGDWLTGLPQAEKDHLLLKFTQDPDVHLTGKLRRRFRDTTGRTPGIRQTGRTVGELLRAAEELRSKREQEEARREAEERARCEAKAARERAAHLASLAGRGEASWEDVDRLVEAKQSKSYAEAVVLLKDLQEIAINAGAVADFRSRVAAICRQHARRVNFVGQVRQAGLLPDPPRGSA